MHHFLIPGFFLLIKIADICTSGLVYSQHISPDFLPLLSNKSNLTFRCELYAPTKDLAFK